MKSMNRYTALLMTLGFIPAIFASWVPHPLPELLNTADAIIEGRVLGNLSSVVKPDVRRNLFLISVDRIIRGKPDTITFSDGTNTHEVIITTTMSGPKYPTGMYPYIGIGDSGIWLIKHFTNDAHLIIHSAHRTKHSEEKILMELDKQAHAPPAGRGEAPRP